MIFHFDDYELDSDSNDLRRNGKPVEAELVVLRLLSALVQGAGQIVTKAELVRRVWDDRAVSDNVITVSMVRLRRLLGDNVNERAFIVNVHGRGYRFVRPVTAVGRGDTPAATAPTGRHTPSFVGREQLMQRLRAALDAAREGQGSVVVLMGEPGIGKTSAAEQLAIDATDAGIIVAWGHCHEAGDTPPLWPWAQLVRELVEKLPLDSAAAEAAARAPELPWLLPRASDYGAKRPEGREIPLGKDRVFGAIVDLLQTGARATPCLLILEDLHRADASTAELLRFWIESIVRTPVLLVGTVRSTETRNGATGAELAAVMGHRNCTRFALQRLDAPSVSAYVSTLLDDPDGRMARAVFAKSEGNPFFMVELARQLSSMASPEPELLSVSHEALQLIRPRLLKLDAVGNGVLSCAAVIGRSFELRLLHEVLERELSDVMRNLDAALASEVLTEAPDSRTAFVFSHDLLRAALYESLPPAERRRLHLRVAHALETERSRGAAVSTAMLAFHFRAALPDDPMKSVKYSARAADEAITVFAYADAGRQLRHALEALALVPQASSALRMTLLLRRALCARVVGAPDFESLTHELIQLARECRAGAALARAGLLLDLHPGFPALAASRQTLEDALALLPADDDEHRGAILARLATSAPLAYDAEKGRAQVALALALGRRSGSKIPLYGALFAKLYLEGSPAAVGTSASDQAELMRELEAMCEQHPRTLSVPPIVIDLHRAIQSFQTGDIAAMMAALDRAESRARRLHCREWIWHVERFQTLAQIQLGQFASAARKLRALHEQARTLRIIGSELFCLHDEAVVLGDAGSKRTLHASLAFDPGDPPSIWSIKVRTLVAAGLHEDAGALLRRVPPERLVALPYDRDYLGTLGCLARAAVVLGAQDYAAALRDLLAPHAAYFSAHVAFLCEGSVPQLQAELAWTLGLRDEARTLLKAGIARSADAGLGLAVDLARGRLATYQELS